MKIHAVLNISDGAGAAVFGKVDDGYGMLSFDLGADGSGSSTIKMQVAEVDIQQIKYSIITIAAYEWERIRFAVKAMGSTIIKCLNMQGSKKDDIDF